MSTTHATYKTHKEAREAGLRTEKKWLVPERLSTGRQRGPMIPRLGEAPIAVRGEAFFAIRQCEEVVTIAEAKKRGLCVPASAKPVRSFRSQHGFRLSDCVPATERSKTKMQGDYLTTTELKARGWTDKLIRQFLSTPDDYRPNPHYQSGPRVCLHDHARVESIERAAEFQAAKKRADRARVRAGKGTETKRKKIMEDIGAVEISVPRLSKKELIRRACRHYNDRKIAEQDVALAMPDSAPDFLERICVNYIRHRLTHYDSVLDKIRGHVGKEEAYTRLRERVLDVIVVTYPWLADECFRQQLDSKCRAYLRCS